MATIGDDLLMSFGVMGGKFPFTSSSSSLLLCQADEEGFMQPQGHVQVLLNKLRGFSAQACLDAPRFCISAGLPVAGQDNSAGDLDSQIFIEEGIDPKVIEELRGMSLVICQCSDAAADKPGMGHDITVAEGWARMVAGRGQIIQAVNDPSGRRVWACGSDLRADGCAVPQI